MRIRLHVMPHRNNWWKCEINKDRCIIGRDPNCQLPLIGEDNDMVSWQHALIELVDGETYISDLTSTNGSFLNGTAIGVRTRVCPGDMIRLGVEGPRIELVDAKETAEPNTASQLTADAVALLRTVPANTTNPWAGDFRLLVLCIVVVTTLVVLLVHVHCSKRG